MVARYVMCLGWVTDRLKARTGATASGGNFIAPSIYEIAQKAHEVKEQLKQGKVTLLRLGYQVFRRISTDNHHLGRVTLLAHRRYSHLVINHMERNNPLVTRSQQIMTGLCPLSKIQIIQVNLLTAAAKNE